MKNWIQLYNGKPFDFDNFNEDSIDIVNIAHGLSHIGRFVGQCKKFYSVAQHSVLVSYIVPPQLALAGLLHDGSEHVLGDINSPLKHMDRLGGYRELEHKVQAAIYNKWHLPAEEDPLVKKADRQLLSTEVRDLLNYSEEDYEKFQLSEKPLPFKIKPLSPKKAEKLFMERFTDLTVNLHKGKTMPPVSQIKTDVIPFDKTRVSIFPDWHEPPGTLDDFKSAATPATLEHTIDGYFRK